MPLSLPVLLDEPGIEGIGVVLVSRIASSTLCVRIGWVIPSRIGNTAEQMTALKVIPGPAEHTSAIDGPNDETPKSITLIDEPGPFVFHPFAHAECIISALPLLPLHHARKTPPVGFEPTTLGLTDARSKWETPR
jgi:hypothetical protein